MQWDWRRTSWGTGFSREGAGCHAAESMVTALASSRLKPVPLTDHVQLAGPADHVHLVELAEHAHLVGPALAGKASDVRPQNRWCLRWPLPG